MNFWEYIGVTRATFETGYLDTRLVSAQHHDKFPLDIYTYGRACVHDNKWDTVTQKCRGIVVNRETGDIVARPFEKFFNFGDTVYGGDMARVEEMGQPTVWEKVDGFLCTGYQWGGKWYCASKGSFHSPHAKWASAKIQALDMSSLAAGVTPVFEGVCKSLRIVVDYKDIDGLILTAVIDNETGQETTPLSLKIFARQMRVGVAQQYHMTMQEAHALSYDETVKNEEGFVLTWYRDGQTPFRLKVKYADYIRIHRMVTGFSPKRILEVIQNGWTTEMDDLLNSSTPWFNSFVTKWKRVIEGEYERIETKSISIFGIVKSVVHSQYLSTGVSPTRKDFALLYTNVETHKELAGVLFAMLDGKDYKQVIWKMVKNSPQLKGGHPMVDAYQL